MDHRSPPNFQPPPCAAQSLFDTMPTTTVPTLTTPTSVHSSCGDDDDNNTTTAAAAATMSKKLSNRDLTSGLSWLSNPYSQPDSSSSSSSSPPSTTAATTAGDNNNDSPHPKQQHRLQEQEQQMLRQREYSTSRPSLSASGSASARHTMSSQKGEGGRPSLSSSSSSTASLSSSSAGSSSRPSPSRQYSNGSSSSSHNHSNYRRSSSPHHPPPPPSPMHYSYLQQQQYAAQQQAQAHYGYAYSVGGGGGGGGPMMHHHSPQYSTAPPPKCNAKRNALPLRPLLHPSIHSNRKTPTKKKTATTTTTTTATPSTTAAAIVLATSTTAAAISTPTPTSTAEELIAEGIMIDDTNGHDININKNDDKNDDGNSHNGRNSTATNIAASASPPATYTASNNNDNGKRNIVRQVKADLNNNNIDNNEKENDLYQASSTLPTGNNGMSHLYSQPHPYPHQPYPYPPYPHPPYPYPPYPYPPYPHPPYPHPPYPHQFNNNGQSYPLSSSSLSASLVLTSSSTLSSAILPIIATTTSLAASSTTFGKGTVPQSPPPPLYYNQQGGDDDDEGDYNQDDHGVEILDEEIMEFISKPTARTASESSPKRTKTNKKKELTPFLDRIGITFPPPLVDIAAMTTVGLPSWPPLKTFCDQHKNLSSPIPIATDAKSLENISIMIIKHFPGDVNLEKMIEYGLLWKTENNYIGEPCLRFLVSFINKMLYALSGDNTRRKINDSIAWWDICPVPGPNNCGGDHNLPELQLLSTEVLIQFMKKCPNLKKILFFGKNPNIYSMEQFLSQLEKRAPELLSAFHPTFRLGSPDFKSPCQYNPHSQFFLMHLNTKKHTMDLMRVGVVVINTVFKIDFTQQLKELSDDGVQEIIPFATEAVIEARRLVISQVLKDHWANPDGPFRNVSQLMKAHWANPDGPFRNVSQKLINYHNAIYSHRQPCQRCGISIRGNYGNGMASHLRACQRQPRIHRPQLKYKY